MSEEVIAYETAEERAEYEEMEKRKRGETKWVK